jgi:hypothetical protein
MAEIQRQAAHVDDREIRREIFLAKNAGIRFRRGLRQPNIAER